MNTRNRNPLRNLVCFFSFCTRLFFAKTHDEFANLKREYLDGLFLAKPHLATYMGDHRFDDRLPDVSPQGRVLRRRMLEQQKLRLNALEEAHLPTDEKIDAHVLSQGIDLELLYLDEIKEWEWEPRLYDSFPYYDPREIIATRILNILHGDFSPLEERVRHATLQMQQLPEFLNQVKSQLKNPVRLNTEQAILDNQGRLRVFEGEVEEFIRTTDGLSPTLRSEAELARKTAVAALEDYQRFLEKDALPRSTQEWRLGAEHFKRKFVLALQTDLAPEDIIPRAELSLRQWQLELLEVSRQLYLELFPGKAMPQPDRTATLESKLVAAIQNELAKDHPEAQDFVDAHRRILSEVRAFVEQENFLALPPADTLRVTIMPPFKQGVAAAEYLSPGLLEHDVPWKAVYYVDPINPGGDPASIESYLREYNNYDIGLTGMHEAYPGHHTQAYFSKQFLNPLRVVLWNSPYTEGWAIYATNLVTSHGYGGKRNLRYSFFNLKSQLRMALNTLIDIELHSHQMTEQEAVHRMMEDGFQEQAAAERKLLRAQLETTQLSQYYVGFEEIQRLADAVKAARGDQFDQKEFNETLLKHGPIPVKDLRMYFHLN
ncbi:MAG: DUF885 domain-containing protein [Terriglobia bacterium]